MSGPVVSLMLAVPDAQAAAAWYERALGATRLWDVGGVVGLSLGGAPFFVDDPDSFVERAVGAGADVDLP